MTEHQDFIPGRFYRRTAAIAYLPGIEGLPWPEGADPVVELKTIEETQHGLGGWFYDNENQSHHFYLAAHVEEVDTLTGMTAAQADDASCALGDGRAKYSRGLCSRCYGRWRKLVKEEGMGEEAATQAVLASIADELADEKGLES